MTKQGNMYILGATCLFSMWTVLIPIPNQTATTIPKALYEHVFTTYAPPATLLSYCGKNIVSKVIAELCALFKVNKKFTLAYRPQSNSSIETKNSIVYKCLESTAKTKMSGTHSYQKFSRQFSPYFIVFDKECPFIIDHNIIPDQGEPVEISEFVKAMLPKMEAMREVVKDNIEEYKKYSKKCFNKDTKPKNFEPGMKVWLEVKQFQLHIPNKLQKKYVGPYYIADR